MLKASNAGMEEYSLLLYVCFLFKVIIIVKIVTTANFYWALDIYQALS